jgi:hypothetical protein
MLADFFTKPLQGSLFRKFRSVLLGEEHTEFLSFVHPSSLSEERVGNKKVTCDAIEPDTDTDQTSTYPVTTTNAQCASNVK